MLEKPEAMDSVTAASVAVAATLDNSEPSEEAKLDSAEDAASVIGAVVVAVGLPLASDKTDDSAEETALAKSEAAEDTTLEATAVPEVASEEVAVVTSVGVEMGIPKMPVGANESVAFVVDAISEDTVSEPSNSDATEPMRPGVAVLPLGPLVSVLSATVSDVDGTEVLLSVNSGIDELSAPEVTSVKAAVEVGMLVLSIMVDRPTVIAPKDVDSEASVLLALPSDKLVPVGLGSAEGSTPIVPTLGAAERVEVTAVELAVGEACSTGRWPV